jgi:hypothetical protein
MTTKNMAHIRIEPTRGVCRFIRNNEQSIFNDTAKIKKQNTIRHEIVGSVK